MKVSVSPGKYVVAVSGGVDSVVLLDLLSKHKGLTLLVVHYDHGIRADSAKDRRFVRRLAAQYGLPFVYEEGHLGSGASEATAREARYGFLRQVVRKQGTAAIITAHHQDDVLETAIINLLRGTGRKGLTALGPRKDILRPLLHVSKSEVLRYATLQQLQWREDPSNKDVRYLRNYVRHQLLPRLSSAERQSLLRLIERQRTVNNELDALLRQQLETQGKTLLRRWFVKLDHQVACECIAAWLRLQGVSSFDRPTIERLVVGAKTAAPGKRIMVKSGRALLVGKDTLALEPIER